MSNDLYRVCLIGSGNVATHIGRALHQSGCIISGVYSKNIQHAQALCSEIAGNVAVDNVSLLPEADFYIISVKDAVIGEVAKRLKSCKPDAFCIHTSGSIPLDVISKHFVQSAVVYPLQTISKNELMDFGNIPLFIEAANSDSLQRAVLLAKSLSTKIYFLDSTQRKRLHLAAVFANNFSNHCFAIAYDLLKQADIDPSCLQPIIQHTVDKLAYMSPTEAQTGPAVRWDTNVLDAHQSALDGNPDLQTLYKLMSKSIHAFHDKLRSE